MANQKSIGREAAIALAETEWWKGKSHREIAEFQMATTEMCCPFGVFHEAVEKTVGRPVFTHEFGVNFDGIWNEIFHGGESPSLGQIIEMIPEDKRAIVVVGGDGESDG